jgi:hypothetical protein
MQATSCAAARRPNQGAPRLSIGAVDAPAAVGVEIGQHLGLFGVFDQCLTAAAGMLHGAVLSCTVGAGNLYRIVAVHRSGMPLDRLPAFQRCGFRLLAPASLVVGIRPTWNLSASEVKVWKNPASLRHTVSAMRPEG